MHASGEVLLVSCYELGHSPTAVAWAAGFLRAAGFQPAVLDLALDPLAPEAVRRARLVALAVPMHTALRLGIAAAERVRVLQPGAHIALFGLYASLDAARLLGSGVADSVIGGECEEPLVALARALARGERPEVEGVATRDRPSRPWLRRPRFVAPARDVLPPLQRYAALIEGERRRVAGHVEASRGCKHLCRHCPIVPVYQGRFVAVPIDIVLADAWAQVEAGATHLSFGDPDFLNGPEHGLRVARALHAAHPGLSFDVTVKVEHLLRHRELLPELRALGCAFVVSAVESLSDRVLERLAKGHTRRDVDAALAATAAAGLPLRPTFVPFTPWSSLDDVLELHDWIEDRDLAGAVDPIQLAIRLLVPPGSALTDLPAEDGGTWPGPLDASALSHRWRHADPRMDELQQALERRVAEAAERDESPELTHAALRALARAAAGLAPRPQAPLLGPRRDHPPRLAEAWFC